MSLTVFDIGNQLEQEKKIAMTPRQWWLYRLIKQASLENRKLSVKDIYESQQRDFEQGLLTYSDLYQFNESEGNHSNCPQIYDDKDLINESDEVDKVLCVKNNQFYLGTDVEAVEYHNKLMYKVYAYSHKAKVVRDKVGQDNQCKLFTFDLIEMEKSKGRDYHEAFINLDTLLKTIKDQEEKIKELEHQLKLQKNESQMWKERYEYLKEFQGS